MGYFNYKIRVSKDTFIKISFCLYFENLTRIEGRIYFKTFGCYCIVDILGNPYDVLVLGAQGSVLLVWFSSFWKFRAAILNLKYNWVQFFPCAWILSTRHLLHKREGIASTPFWSRAYRLNSSVFMNCSCFVFLPIFRKFPYGLLFLENAAGIGLYTDIKFPLGLKL